MEPFDRSTWLKKIEKGLNELRQIPLWGYPPLFPWKLLEQQLQALLEVDALSLKMGHSEWQSGEEATSSMGEKPLYFSIELIPLSSFASLIISRETLIFLTETALVKGGQSENFSEPALQEGFFLFLALNLCHLLNENQALKDLKFSIIEKTDEGREEGLATNVSISIRERTAWLKIFFPQTFLYAFRLHFAEKSSSIPLSQIAKTSEVSLALIIGSTFLSLNEWQKIKVGDCILLDRCLYDPLSQKGTARLVLETVPLFRIRLKQGKAKIVDYAYYEETKPMVNDNEDTNYEEHPEEEELFEELESELPEEEKEPAHFQERLESLQKVPIELSVEVTRIKMPLEHLMQLKPGNVLELDKSVEQGVFLTLNGKLVAKGELLKIGEMLGIKILELG